MSVKDLLSGREILEFANIINRGAIRRKKPTLVLYRNLTNSLKENVAYFILYEASPMNGHWVLLFHDRIWEFFDPYGMIIDSQLDFTYYDEYTKKTKPLIDILTKYGEVFEINTVPFQELGEDINTCGKWCLMRYYYYTRGHSYNDFVEDFTDIDDEELNIIFNKLFYM